MKKIKFLITLTLIVILVVVWNEYQKINMNIFSRAESVIGTSEFSRDGDVKYSEDKSYKIKSDVYNDAMIFTTVDVEPNKVYKVTCMVKTNNVTPQTENCGAGANICIANTTEQSKAIIGTEDWQMLEFKFNSKNRKSVPIGFRLGGNNSDCTGEVWFSDFKIEEGFADTSNEWDFACFIIKNLDVEIESSGITERVQISITDSEIKNILSDIERFEKTCETLSGNKMTVDCEVIYIDEPLTSITYEDSVGYFVSSYDVENLIDDYVQANSYDHIFTVVKLDSEKYQDTIEIQDWVGLGYMDYHGIGFSNIRIPSDSSKFMYIYDTRINTFPEEVFLHEFLHSLERNSQEYGLEIIELHAYENYGYVNESLVGLKKWYADYMTKSIYDSYSQKNVGLDEKVYSLKPPHSIDFTYSIQMDDVFTEPKNIFEEFKIIIKNIGINLKNFSYLERNTQTT